jgi:Predicted permeases
MNAVVGSGTLITFPLLLAFGYSPVIANVSNTIGLVPGSLSGAYGYRRELKGRGRLLLRLTVPGVLGGVVGAGLLLALPASAFKTIVPLFIAIALVLVVIGPRLSRALASRPRHVAHHRFALPLALFLCGVYGGYFGAAQGILLLAVLGVTLSASLQEINGMKNVLVMFVNLVAGVVFVIFAEVAWWPVALIAAGAIVGGQIGATAGRKLPDSVLRGVIVVVGVAAIVKLLV